MLADMPEGVAVKYNNDQRDFMNASADRALNTRAETESRLKNAISGAEKTFSPYDVQMSSALTNRYRNSLNDKLKGLRAQIVPKSFAESSQSMGDAARLEGARLAVHQRNLKRMHDAQNAAEVARAQVIGSVLGLGGTAAGFAMGGPAGASVGSQMGQSAGAAATGGQSQGTLAPSQSRSYLGSYNYQSNSDYMGG